jgi:hypothetical protein
MIRMSAKEMMLVAFSTNMSDAFASPVLRVRWVVISFGIGKVSGGEG